MMIAQLKNVTRVTMIPFISAVVHCAPSLIVLKEQIYLTAESCGTAKRFMEQLQMFCRAFLLLQCQSKTAVWTGTTSSTGECHSWIVVRT